MPACPADAERVLAGADPYIRTVQVGAQRVPYWEGGQAYAPWAQGYYSRWSGSDLLSGVLIGGFLFGGGGNMFGGVGDGIGGDRRRHRRVGGIGDGLGERRCGDDVRRHLRLIVSSRLAAQSPSGSSQRLDQRHQGLRTATVDLDRGQRVAAGHAAVDDHHVPPCFAWWRTNRSPDITVSDDPSTTSTSPASTSS